MNDLESIVNKVIKKSGRPFKSTFKVNTIKGVTEHPTTHNPCYTFEEDDSYVECRKCKLYTPNLGSL
jgi:hypothetical protein